MKEQKETYHLTLENEIGKLKFKTNNLSLLEEVKKVFNNACDEFLRELASKIKMKEKH